MRIPGSVELGPITLSVKSGDQEFLLSAEVAEYRPAELELSLRVDRELAVRGESVGARSQGLYLFGAPARDASMYWSARYLPRSFAPAATRASRSRTKTMSRGATIRTTSRPVVRASSMRPVS